MKIFFCRSFLRMTKCLLLALFLIPTNSHADKTQDIKTAKRIYVEGMQFFNKNRFKDAQTMLKQSARLLPKKGYERVHRTLNYYLGICHYKTKEYTKSKTYFTRFLEKATGIKKRAKAKMYLKKLQKRIVKRRPPPRRRRKGSITKQPNRRVNKRVATIKRPPPTITKEPGPWRVWPFILTGVGMAVVGAAAVTGLLAQGTEEARDQKYKELLADQALDSQEVMELHNAAKATAGIANILYVVGGIITAGGIALIITAGREPAKEKVISSPTPPPSKVRPQPKTPLRKTRKRRHYRRKRPRRRTFLPHHSFVLVHYENGVTP